MSVKDCNKVLIITDCLDGHIIDTIEIDTYCIDTIDRCILDLFHDYCIKNEHGFMVKNGYNN